MCSNTLPKCLLIPSPYCTLLLLRLKHKHSRVFFLQLVQKKAMALCHARKSIFAFCSWVSCEILIFFLGGGEGERRWRVEGWRMLEMRGIIQWCPEVFRIECPDSLNPNLNIPCTTIRVLFVQCSSRPHSLVSVETCCNSKVGGQQLKVDYVAEVFCSIFYYSIAESSNLVTLL